MRILCILATVIFLSCANKTENEDYKKVAELFITNYRQGNFKESFKYCSPKMERSIKTSFIRSNKNYTDNEFVYKFKSSSIENNEARVEYEWKGKINTIVLENVNGVWKVNYQYIFN